MGTGQGPPKQQQYAPYTPQPQYYVQQPTPPEQQSQSQYQQQQQQHQQYQQYQQYQPYQPPQQPQYHHSSQPQYAPSPQTPLASASAPPPPQQQFLAELESTTALKPRPTPAPSSTASAHAPATAPAKDQSQHGTDPVAFEMHAEPAESKPGVQPTNSPTTTSASSAVSPPPEKDDAAAAAPKLPVIQANPWGFFLPDDLSERADSTSPTKDAPELHQALSVKPLKIVKTGSSSPEHGAAEGQPAASTQGGSRPPSDLEEDAMPRPLVQPAETDAVQPVPVDDLSGTAQLAPAPLNIARPQPPAPTSPVTAPAAPQLPYPVDAPSIPTPEAHPQPGVQSELALHLRPAGSSPGPTSPTILAHSPPSPSHTTTLALQPQYSQPPQQAYTQASPASPIIVQAALPPTLPMSSYFPQQQSYARPEATSPAPSGNHHSPSPSISAPPEASQTLQPYNSPPPSYTQAISQGRPSTTSPAPSQNHQHLQSPPGCVSANPTAIPLPMSPPLASPYPYSPSSVTGDKPFHQTPSPPIQQHQQHQFQSFPQAPPPIPQPSYVNGPQHYQPTPPPLPPRTSPPTSGTPHSGYAHPSPYGPPPTRPNYQAPPPKADSRLFSTATARKLLNKTTELVDQTIAPYLQDHRYRPPYNQYQNPYPNPYAYLNQHQGRPVTGPQGQYYQQGYAPSQPTYAAPQAARENPDVQRPS